MLIFVSLNQISDNPFQKRQEYGDIAELAGDILRHKTTRPDTLGLQQVPTARLVGDDGELVPASGLDSEDWLNDKGQLLPGWRVQMEFGHRRKRAFDYLATNGAYEYAKMPLNILDLSDDDMLDGVWSENAKRKDISAVEEAELIRLKLARLGPNATHAAIGQEWGLSRPVISNRLGLLELPESVKQANRDGRLSERQALALKPVLRIGELTQDSDVKWGKKVGEQWGDPASPEAYVEYVLANPDTITSDDVREFGKRLTRHAGVSLPDWLAKEKIEGPGIEQPQCKACQFRIDQSCMKASCMKAKLEVWPGMALAVFSEESGIPISDREADFEPFENDHHLRNRLRALYATGETGGGMVCAWRVGSGGGNVRPYGEKSGDHVYRVTDEKDGRCGIALGYRGNLPAAEAGGNQSGEPVYEMPEAELIIEWNAEAPKIQKGAHKTMTAALADELLNEVADFDVLQALIFPADAEWIDDVGKLVKKVTEFLISQGRGVGYAYSAYDLIHIYQSAVKRAGLQIDVLGSPSEAVEKTAVVILQGWYGGNGHTGYGWENNAKRVAQRIAQWEQLPGAAASPMAEHIARAKRHIEQKIAAEGEGPKKEAEIRQVVDLLVGPPDERTKDYQEWPGLPVSLATGGFACPGCHEGTVFMNRRMGGATDGACTSCGNEVLVANNKYWAKVVTAVPNDTPAPTNDTLAVAWLRAYVDDTGRTWRELEPNQTHHANSPCFQAFTRAFPDEAEPKWQLKQARAVLEQEAAVSDPWVCEVCAQEFRNEADLLAHQFATTCEKELQETAVSQEVSA